MKISTRIFSLAVLGLVSLLGGCASAPTFKTTSVPASAAMASVYVYSFLDVRERELGANYMREIEKQLEAALALRGVRSKQLWFNRAPIRDEFALNAEPYWNMQSSGSTVRVPVREVMISNISDEKAFGPSHVLVVFPSDTTNTGIGFAYTITWRLMDLRMGQLAWSATSQTDNVNWNKPDERPVDRARALVDGLMKELDRNRLLPAVGSVAAR